MLVGGILISGLAHFFINLTEIRIGLSDQIKFDLGQFYFTVSD